MAKTDFGSARVAFKAAARKAQRQKYVLRLYIAGITPCSREALGTVLSICEKELAGRCELKVIDLHKQPALAQDEQIVAVPTLIKESPQPPRRFIGSMVNKERLLAGLDLPSRKSHEWTYER